MLRNSFGSWSRHTHLYQTNFLDTEELQSVLLTGVSQDHLCSLKTQKVEKFIWVIAS